MISTSGIELYIGGAANDTFTLSTRTTAAIVSGGGGSDTIVSTLDADYVLADATVYPFDPASFDILVSRFGVMFFADPVLSFRNLRKSLRPRGRLVFACWREPRENGWMMAPLMAVYKHVPKLPQLGPEDPGPFAFADDARVKRILGEAGFTDVARHVAYGMCSEYTGMREG